MFTLAIIASIICLSTAMVCPRDYCKKVKQPVLNCKGGVIKNAGFCGCYDICAKVEGESCKSWHFRGIPNVDICDKGLECQPSSDGSILIGQKCVKPETSDKKELKRLSRCETPCQRKSLMCTISMIVYQGQWFAKCDQSGYFLPEQCDNTNHCFCVDTQTGAVIGGSKVLGNANC